MSVRARKGRPKGYASWKPEPATEAVVWQVQQVLREYRDFLPLTVRQIFYRLVGAYGYDKTEKAYARLCEYLVRARRAQMLPFEHIRDDGTTHNSYAFYGSPADFWRETEARSRSYSRDMLAEQPVYVELWCEAAGMVPQMERVANQFAVPVYSTGGFGSVTVTYEIAERALRRDKPTVFLHIGDFDPSGESIFEAMTEDARQFLYNRLVWKLRKEATAGQTESQTLLDTYWPDDNLFPKGGLPDTLSDLRPVRVALTAAQVEEHDLPTAPPKATDTRSASWVGETCQAEAMPPDLLAETVESAIREVLDEGILDRVSEQEKTERDEIRERVREILRENDDRS